jgi:hypothetical protein
MKTRLYGVSYGFDMNCFDCGNENKAVRDVIWILIGMFWFFKMKTRLN